MVSAICIIARWRSDALGMQAAPAAAAVRAGITGLRGSSVHGRSASAIRCQERSMRKSIHSIFGPAAVPAAQPRLRFREACEPLQSHPTQTTRIAHVLGSARDPTRIHRARRGRDSIGNVTI